MRQPLSPRAAGTVGTVVIISLLFCALLGADALGIGQGPARPPHVQRYTPHRPLPDLCAAMTGDRLAVALTPASTEHDDQDRDATGCYWESRRGGARIPADLRIEVKRPDPVVSAGGAGVGEARDDYREKTADSQVNRHFAPVAGVGTEAAVAIEHDPDLGDDAWLVVRDVLLVVRIEYSPGPERSRAEETSVLVRLARTVLSLMPPGGR